MNNAWLSLRPQLVQTCVVTQLIVSVLCVFYLAPRTWGRERVEGGKQQLRPRNPPDGSLRASSGDGWTCRHRVRVFSPAVSITLSNPKEDLLRCQNTGFQCFPVLQCISAATRHSPSQIPTWAHVSILGFSPFRILWGCRAWSICIHVELKMKEP